MKKCRHFYHPGAREDELKNSGFGDVFDREKIRHQIMNY